MKAQKRRSSTKRSFVVFVLLWGILFGSIAVTGQDRRALKDRDVSGRYQRLITPDGLAARLYFLASARFAEWLWCRSTGIN
jgi:hypothetical protein